MNDLPEEGQEDVDQFYVHLKANCDRQGIFRYAPQELQRELLLSLGEIEEMLEALYVHGCLVYVTRINKDTGEVLKVVQLLEGF